MCTISAEGRKLPTVHIQANFCAAAKLHTTENPPLQLIEREKNFCTGRESPCSPREGADTRLYAYCHAHAHVYRLFEIFCPSFWDSNTLLQVRTNCLQIVHDALT
jgi:hypothetical protein